MAPPLIRLEGITRIYRVGDSEVRALDGVDLVIETGEFVALMGPSGSGKSTLLHVIGCLDVPTAGRFLFDGEPVEDLSEDRLTALRQTRMGFVFQSYHLVPRMTALRVFDQAELSEVNLLAASVDESAGLAERARALIADRHGHDDVTIVTQKDALAMVDAVMWVLSGTVTAIAAISLLVGAIGIFTILWIVVQERMQEVGLVMAIGARRRQVLAWYLCEAAVTGLVGGAVGLAGALGLGFALAGVVPGLSFRPTPEILIAALGMAIAVGLLAGVAPAVRASRLDPIEALRAE